MSKKKIFAVLIGINNYRSCPLNGCVNDIIAVHDFFTWITGQPENEDFDYIPTFLLAPGVYDKALSGDILSKNEKPTRENIIAAFDHFKDADAERGDICLIYYSGHGITLAVPEAFKIVEPSGRFEAIVCLNEDDSVSCLIDKEIAYLISKTLEDKSPYSQDSNPDKQGVHFLAIMDCCHSGSITRGEKANKISIRRYGDHLPPPKVEQLLGYNEGGDIFYKNKRPDQQLLQPNNIQHARYIQIASARHDEKAKEKGMIIEGPGAINSTGKIQTHGIFTYSLLTMLYQTGCNVSYRELVNRVGMEVKSRVSEQTPQLDPTQAADADLFFLRNELKTPSPVYPVRYNDVRDEWVFGAGSINGIPEADSPDTFTEVTLTTGRKAKVIQVFGTSSLLDPAAFTEEDKHDFTIQAKITRLAIPQILIGFSKQMEAKYPEKCRMLKECLKKMPHFYFSFSELSEIPDYVVEMVPDKHKNLSFVLQKVGYEEPLFTLTQNPEAFLSDINKVGKWEYVSKMSNPKNNLKREEVKVVFNIKEGIQVDAETLNEASWDPRSEQVNPKGLKIRLFEKKESLIKLYVKTKRKLFVKVLYLDSRFGITVLHAFSVKTQNKEGGDFEYSFGFEQEGTYYNFIPVNIPKEYIMDKITEIEDHLIVFVSEQEADIEGYKQLPIELNVSRSPGFSSSNIRKVDGWVACHFPVEITMK